MADEGLRQPDPVRLVMPTSATLHLAEPVAYGWETELTMYARRIEIFPLLSGPDDGSLVGPLVCGYHNAPATWWWTGHEDDLPTHRPFVWVDPDEP
jgi:hypothetical protein